MKIVLAVCLCTVTMAIYGNAKKVRHYPSFLFKDKEQVDFVASLQDYMITKPRFSLTTHIHLNRCPWKEIQIKQPPKFYVKLRLNQRSIKLKLLKNNDLLRTDFALEDVTKDLQRLQRLSGKNKPCYYSGKVMNSIESRVALSVCDGLKGFITFERRSYIIEPMGRIGSNYLHLVYESRAELNSTHNPKKGKVLQCATGNYYREDSKPVNIEELFDQPIGHSVTRRSSSDVITNQVDDRGDDVDLPGATVEVFVVVDKHMVAFHGNQSLQNYVLTMMNMVADMYKDPSLGVLIDIVVAKILVLHEDPKNLKISNNGDQTLLNFCEWQFLRALSNDNQDANSATPQYDVALLLTRKDVCAHSDSPCGTIGLAYIGGMCTTNRKCAVIEDIGLNTAYTIAHELGHNLGMSHDGNENGCKEQSGGYPHMMAAQWPTNNQVPLKWSSCSVKKITDFLSSYKSYCLHHPKTEQSSNFGSYELSGILPGKLYDADTQCRQQYGGVAKHCPVFKSSGISTNMCKHLWCEIEEEEECVSKLDPAAKGTKCGRGKWCMYGKCVNNTDIPDSIDGGWSTWKNWTVCSRTCGVGVTYMERLCNRPIPRNGGRYCNGENRRYMTCNTTPCPKNSVSIRAIQCDHYSNKTIQYIPVHSELHPCALHCRPTIDTAHYSIKFQRKVTDGTPCHQGTSDICIDGMCEKLGCDLKINSKLQKDVCGVCGGNGESCNLIQGEFTQPLGQGYVNAVDIPQGAKYVLVKEVKPCASFLALRSGEHGSYSYHINGNWTIELPGKYNVNGTVVYYRRRGTQELFYTEGPTKAKMHFMVLFQDFNFGVEYKYVLPKNTTVNSTTKPKLGGSFGWIQGLWAKCPVVCGGGIMRRKKPKCLNMHQGNVSVVDDHFCSDAKMPPPQEKTCNEHKCPKVWMVTAWSKCSQTCGLGRKKRNITCSAQLPDGRWENRSQSECAVSGKPVSIQTCVQKACYLRWRTSAWSKCRGECGKWGFKYRSVSCPKKDACLQSSKPEVSKRCRAVKCNFQWAAGPWSQCSKTCGKGYLKRSVVCREENSYRVVDDSKCFRKRRLRSKKKCNLRDCAVKTNISKKRNQKTIDVVANKKSTVEKKPTNIVPPKRNRKLNPPSKHSQDLIKILHPLLVQISPPDKSPTKCRDHMASWACRIQIIIAGYANKRFCEGGDNQKCCATCKLMKKTS